MLKSTAIVTFAAFASSGTAFAGGSVKNDEYREYKTERISAEIALGVMTGKASELVFDPNAALISKLIWKYDSNVMLSGGLAITPFQRFTIGLRGRINLTGNSTMDDFDFPGSACGIAGPLCQSHHENTMLERSTSVDLFAAHPVYQTGSLKLSGVVGYRWDHSAWDARGGTSNYTLPFPNVSVITYDQWWEAPYLGIEATGFWDRFNIHIRVVGSTLAQGTGRDDHRLRTLLFTDDFNPSGFVSTKVKVGYDILDRASVTFAWDYDRWFTAKGPTVVHNYATGSTVSFSGDAAGANSEANTISMGLQYKY